MHECFKKRTPDVVSGFLKSIGMLVTKCRCGATHFTDVYRSDDDFIIWDETRIKESESKLMQGRDLNENSCL